MVRQSSTGIFRIGDTFCTLLLNDFPNVAVTLTPDRPDPHAGDYVTVTWLASNGRANGLAWPSPARGGSGAHALLLAWRVALVIARNDTLADEPLLNFGDSSFFDDLPRREALQIWGIGVVELRRLADQIRR